MSKCRVVTPEGLGGPGVLDDQIAFYGAGWRPPLLLLTGAADCQGRRRSGKICVGKKIDLQLVSLVPHISHLTEV